MNAFAINILVVNWRLLFALTKTALTIFPISFKLLNIIVL